MSREEMRGGMRIGERGDVEERKERSGLEYVLFRSGPTSTVQYSNAV